MAQSQVSFTSTAGNAVNLDFLLKTTRGIATDLQSIIRAAAQKSPALLESLENIIDDLVRIIPDKDAAAPPSDPIGLAQEFLAEERYHAYKFLEEDAHRQRKIAKLREAFSIPANLIHKVFIAPLEEEGQPLAALDPQERHTLIATITERFTAAGWTVSYDADNQEYPVFTQSREPLRKLHEILLSSQPLAQQVVEVIDAAHQWYSATLYPALYPAVLYPHKTITLDAEAAFKDLRYPRLSMELVEVEHSCDIPEEWQQPLV